MLLQLESQKNTIEIELKESLRRREEDIQARLEVLGEPADDGTTTADDLGSRTRELRGLNSSIDSLTRRVKGWCIDYVRYSFPYLSSFRNGKGS